MQIVNNNQSAVRKFSLLKIKESTENFKNLIGKGGFGEVIREALSCNCYRCQKVEIINAAVYYYHVLVLLFYYCRNCLQDTNDKNANN